VHWTGVLDRDGVQRMDDRPRYWFAAKRYRWGWRVPLTWEGCLVDAIWFIAFIGISPYVQERQHPFKSLGLVFGPARVLSCNQSLEGRTSTLGLLTPPNANTWVSNTAAIARTGMSNTLW